MTTLKEFWSMADETRWEAQYEADKRLKYLQNAPLEVVQEVCRQYRYFPKEFPYNLGILVARSPYGKFKSLMSQILADELGNGKADRAHINMYDRFLISIGVDENMIEGSIIPDNFALLEEKKKLALSQSLIYVIGLSGMGAECLCQVYLSLMHKNFANNPLIKANKENIDWTFWDYHVGEPDIIHRQKVKEAINEIAEADPSCVDELNAGYQKGKGDWDLMWDNIYDYATKQPMAVI